MVRDPEVFLKLVLMYVEEGLVEKTMEIVSAMNRAKIRVSDCIFCAIVNGFSKRRGLRAAVKVYEDLILRLHYLCLLSPRALSTSRESICRDGKESI